MTRRAVFAVGMIAATASITAAPPGTVDGDFFFTEGFDDANLAERGWYDLGRYRIVEGAAADSGCVEYEWTKRGAP
jgi:hypothetical protein